VYAVQRADEIWVVHAFQKKSTEVIKTPKPKVDLLKDRLNRLRDVAMKNGKLPVVRGFPRPRELRMPMPSNSQDELACSAGATASGGSHSLLTYGKDRAAQPNSLTARVVAEAAKEGFPISA
jgi:hypothetical protein